MRQLRKKDLSIDKKAVVAQFMLLHSIDGKAKYGAVNEAAVSLGLSVRSVGRIWAETKRQLSEGNAITFSNARKIEHAKTKQTEVEKHKELPMKKRSTYRRIAKELGVSKSLVGLWQKKRLIIPHTNAIKTDLTTQNKLLRLHFSLSSLEFQRDNNIIKFKEMHNKIHIDEKWFFITKASDRYYLLPEEAEPYRSCKSKRFITKVMFIAAVFRPIYAVSGELIFYGKIGLFPFIKKEPAQRNSKNRAKGNLETKSIEAITKQVIKDCLINQVLPAIKFKWPPNISKEIFIQQDNVRPHIKYDDIEFRKVATSDGFNIQLICQPANSPDTNINDLDFFRTIQILQEDTSSYNMDDLIKNVVDSYEQLTHIILNNVFQSLQGCMIEMMKCKGHNCYKIPHMDKEKLIREGRLPDNLQDEEHIVKECIDYLRQPENQIESPYDVETLISNLDY